MNSSPISLMTKLLAVHLLIPVLLLAQKQFPAWFAQLPEAREGQVLIVGYAGRYTKLPKAHDAAVSNALKTLCQYYQMQLKFDLIELSDGRMQITNPIFEKSINTSLIDQFAANISVLDSLPTEEGYFMLISYPPSGKKFEHSNPKSDWGPKPAWIDDLPRQKGYVFGLGQVARYAHWLRGWRDADDYARFDLAKSLQLETESIRAEKRDNRMTKTTILKRQSIDFVLKKANIVARWYDQATDTYYSLCRAPRQ